MSESGAITSDDQVRESIVQEAIERVRSRGDSTRRFAVMELPVPLLNDLCGRLLSQSNTVRGVAEWLAGELAARGLDSIGRSSVERFSDVLFEEYRIADMRRRRAASSEFKKAVATGDAGDLGMTANLRMAELVDDWLMRIDQIDDLDVKEIMALSIALRQVNQTLFDKRKTDARIEALEKLNQERDAAIKLKEQLLAEKDLKLQAEKEKREKAVAAAEKAAAKGESGAAVVERVREILGIG